MASLGLGIPDVLRQSGFALLLGGQAVSVLGDYFGTAAQSVLVYQLTGSKVAMGTLWLFHFLPMVILRLLSGPLLDRVDRRRLLMATEWLRVAACLAPAALYATGLLQVWHLFGVSFVTGAAAAVFHPVQMALVPDLVPAERLSRANALLEGSRGVISLLGPALGAAFVLAFGPGLALVVDALSFVLSAVSVQLIRMPHDRAASSSSGEPFLRRLGEGFSFFREHQELLWLAGALAVINGGEAAIIAQLLPYATEQLGTNVAGMGILESAFALGALLSTFVVGAIGEIRRRRLSLLGAPTVMGLAMMSLGLTQRFSAALPLAAVYGATGPFFNIVYMTYYGRLVPDHLRARVFALRMVMATAAMPLGSFLGGLVAETWGIKPLFLAAGLVITLASVAVYFQPVMRRVDGELPTPARAPQTL